MGHVNKAAVFDVLNGEVSRIIDALTWCESPQGARYWDGIYCSGVLPEEARLYLESLLGPEESKPMTTYAFRNFTLDEEGNLKSRYANHPWGTLGSLKYSTKEEGRSVPLHVFQLTGGYMSELKVYGIHRRGDHEVQSLVEIDPEGNEKIFGEVNAVQKAFGLKTPEDVIKFYVKRASYAFNNGDISNWIARDLVETLLGNVRGVDHNEPVEGIDMFWPNFTVEGVEVWMNIRDLERGRRTVMKTGRFFRTILNTTDANIEIILNAYNERFQKRPFTLHRSKEQEAFKNAYTKTWAKMLNPRTTSARKSLPNSCMHDMDIQGHSPGEVYASGDFEVLWLENERGSLGGRVVVYVPEEGQPQAGPVYGTCEHSLDMLEQALRDMGAKLYDDGASWTGARMKVINVYGSDLLMCYCDMEEEGELDGDYIVLGSGPIELCVTQGYVGSHGRCSCCECGDSVDEDNVCHNQHGDEFCEHCYYDMYVNCEVTHEEINRSDALEVYTCNSRYVWRCTIESPGSIMIDPDSVDYSECEHTGEIWLTDDMEIDVEGNMVSPRYAKANMYFVNDNLYTEEQLKEAGLDHEGNELEQEEEKGEAA
jgi:hypothetical protein